MNKALVSPHPHEIHRSQRSGWLRAAVLGMNDGVVSTSSLMIGVLASSASSTAIVTAGIAGLVAGASSMALGEYVSVSSQRDAEEADIAIEARSIALNPAAELAELAAIYEHRGLDAKLAHQVAKQLHDHDAVVAHARDELGIDQTDLPNPALAAFASATSFSVGAILPIAAAVIFAGPHAALAIVVVSLAALAVSGAMGAHIGGGSRAWAAIRVFVGGGLAMGVTALIGHLIGSGLK